MHRVSTIIAAVLAALVVLFAFQNLAPVDVTFLFWTFTASRALVIIVSMLVGLVAGAIAVYARHRHARKDDGEAS